MVNEKLARSRIVGGTVGGIGMAMFEDTITDAGSGRIANATFGDYLLAVNADVPDMDVVFVGEPDPDNPVGVKGIGEIGLVEIAPAIANGIYHAAGRRIRSLPITIDQLFWLISSDGRKRVGGVALAAAWVAVTESRLVGPRLRRSRMYITGAYDRRAAGLLVDGPRTHTRH